MSKCAAHSLGLIERRAMRNIKSRTSRGREDRAPKFAHVGPVIEPAPHVKRYFERWDQPAGSFFFLSGPTRQLTSLWGGPTEAHFKARVGFCPSPPPKPVTYGEDDRSTDTLKRSSFLPPGRPARNGGGAPSLLFSFLCHSISCIF